MIKVILDTNFLLIPGNFKVDIFEEIDRICDFKYTLCVVDKTLDELEKIISEQKGKDKASAKMALDILKVKGVKVLKTDSGKLVDDILVDIAQEEQVAVATQDKALKLRLKEKGARIILLRQKKHLILA